MGSLRIGWKGGGNFHVRNRRQSWLMLVHDWRGSSSKCRILQRRRLSMFLTRRQFMKASAGTIVALAIADKALALTALQPVIEVGNPLGEYPDRSWERVYHDQYRYDSSFTYVCTPNEDRKSTRLNSSHLVISYAVFCLKKKKTRS